MKNTCGKEHVLRCSHTKKWSKPVTLFKIILPKHSGETRFHTKKLLKPVTLFKIMLCTRSRETCFHIKKLLKPVALFKNMLPIRSPENAPPLSKSCSSMRNVCFTSNWHQQTLVEQIIVVDDPPLFDGF